MLAFEIRFLTGRYAAAQLTNRSEPEWPPHPARVFSALTAALHDDPTPPEPEIQALEWLAAAGHPDIIASDAATRYLGEVYVPTNDQRVLPDIDQYVDQVRAEEDAHQELEGADRARAETRLRKAEAKLVDKSLLSAAADGKGTPANAAELLNRRLKPQPRPFPVAIPHDDTVCMIWHAAPASNVRDALDTIASRVARLGHSSSLVAMRVVDVDAMRPVRDGRRWIPSENGETYLRSVTGPGHLQALQDAHQRHQQTEARILPAEPVLYGAVASDGALPPIQTLFAGGERDWIVFRVVASPEDQQRQLYDVSLAQHVARAMRGLVLGKLDASNSPAVLTGHTSDGRPAEETHLAFVPLADVRHGAGLADRYASGSILGLALIPPADFELSHRDVLIEAIFHAEQAAAQRFPQPSNSPPEPAVLRLTMGREGVLFIQRLRGTAEIETLKATRWVKPATRWLTATPIALSRNPGNLLSRYPEVVAKAVATAERIVMAECEHIGLPLPTAVWIHRRSLVNGVPAAHRFMPFPAGGSGPKRVCVHAEILFDELVRGPVLLGAGRYFGLGLCVPSGGAH